MSGGRGGTGTCFTPLPRADGKEFHQMRAFHLFKGDGEISFGIYAASPIDHSFTAKFSQMEVTECKWAAWSAQDTGFNQTK